MSGSASNYCLLNLVVDFNIINTRRGQPGTCLPFVFLAYLILWFEECKGSAGTPCLVCFSPSPWNMPT